MWEHTTRADPPTEQDIILKLTCGILIPLSGIKHAFKSYCWEHGLRVEFSQCGFLQRDVTIKVSGRMTDAEAISHKATMDNATEKEQGIDIPLNGSVEMTEPSVFSVKINRWDLGGGDECFVIVVKDGNGAIVHRSEFHPKANGVHNYGKGKDS